jgi:hypothetical protein
MPRAFSVFSYMAGGAGLRFGRGGGDTVMHRCSLLVMLLLLSSVGPASAECAWVLWMRETSYSGVDEKPWELQRAVPTYKGCEAAQADSIKNITVFWTKPGVTVSPVGSTVLISIHDSDGKIVTSEMRYFRCLPDTIDPRGPKGK